MGVATVVAAVAATAMSVSAGGDLPPLPDATHVVISEPAPHGPVTVFGLEPGKSMWAEVSADSRIFVDTGKPGELLLGNVTAVGASSSPGHVRAWPCDQPMPNTSAVNYTVGAHATPNFVTARADKWGRICFYTSGDADVLWDQYGAVQWPSVGVLPRRVVDTRTSGVKVAAGGVLRVASGEPSSAVLGNLTVVAPEGAGHTRVWPCDQPMPNTSVSNFRDGVTVANFTAVRTDARGEFCVYTSGAAHVLFDVASIVPPSTPAGSPRRVVDTRTSGVKVAAGGVLRVASGEPSSAVLGNLTVVAPEGAGHTRVWPCDQPMPNTSVSNFRDGVTVANFTAVRTDARGEFCVYTSGAAHVLFDVNGAGRFAPASMLGLASAPSRLLDSRLWGGGPSGGDDDHWTTLDSASPVDRPRWDPCLTGVDVYVNWGRRSQEAEKPLLLGALRDVSAASGIPFVYRGSTSILPTTGNWFGLNSSQDAVLNPQQWVQQGRQLLVVALTDKNSTDAISAGALAVGGYTYYGPPFNSIRYGHVTIDTLSPAWSTNTVKSLTYMHEIGHTAGLGHVSDARQVMNPVLEKKEATWGRGDLHGWMAHGAASGCTSN